MSKDALPNCMKVKYITTLSTQFPVGSLLDDAFPRTYFARRPLEEERLETYY